MQARAFNTISVDKKQGILTKSSNNFLKIKDEVKYYLNLPPQLLSLFPTLLSYKENFTSYTMEYIPSKDLSDLIVSEKITFSEGEYILESLFKVLHSIHSFRQSRPISPSVLTNFYINKTLERIYSLKSNPALRPLIEGSHIVVNGKKYKTFKSLEEKFINSFKRLVLFKPALTAIHGDFCFSNILYSLSTHKIKLIDPRGSFLDKGIYGDPHYDYAKLLHCLHGKYDFILNNNYSLKEIKENEFTLDIYSNVLTKNLLKKYKILLNERGINLNFLYFIEASLFLSMVSLHYEDLERQKALFIKGLTILNNFFEKKYENLH
ncbi:MAG: aminoglycoside phosphotransferase family protein [Bacteroidetes bacterium]|nr:aminoglycoside phosphotransferase family protein [Bacteroidota bacterium]